MEEEINLRDYIDVVIKRKYLILAIMFAVSLFVGWPSLSRKDMFEAKAKIMLKEGGGGSGGSTSQLASMLGVKSDSNSNFLKVFTSRSVAEIAINRLGLRSRIKGWDDPKVTMAELADSLVEMIKITNGDMTEIKVKDSDPLLAADLVNGYIAAGEEYWRRYSYSEARKKREYIESQLPRIESELKKAEDNIKKFTLLASETGAGGIDLKRMEREAEIQNTTYLMLRKEYESVKLDESKELAPLTVIDRAEVPTKPTKPKIFLNFVIGAVFGGFISIFLTFFLEYWEKSGKR